MSCLLYIGLRTDLLGARWPFALELFTTALAGLVFLAALVFLVRAVFLAGIVALWAAGLVVFLPEVFLGLTAFLAGVLLRFAVCLLADDTLTTHDPVGYVSC